MKTVKATINIIAEFAKGRLRPEQLQRMHAFAYVVGGDDKPVARGALDKEGKASLEVTFVGERLPLVEVELSALPSPKVKSAARTRRVTISDWKKTQVELKIPLSAALLSASDWWDEPFVVEGKLVARYFDQETEELKERPIQYARVKLYEVDKASLQPCLVACKVVCLPRFEPQCVPDLIDCIPKKLCAPDLQVEECRPAYEFEPCLPTEICPPLGPGGECKPHWPGCAPYNPDIMEFDHVIREALEGKLPLVADAARTRFPGQAYSGRFATRLAPMMSTPAAPPAPQAKCLPLVTGGIAWPYSKSQLDGSSVTDLIGDFRFEFTRADFFTAPAGTTHTEDKDWDEWPDLLFEAELFIDGQWRTIYSEPYSKTRWNIEDTSYWTKLVVDGEYGAENADGGLNPNQSESFLFHGIGAVEPGWIDSNGVISAPPAGHAWKDHVFGSTLTIRGQFAPEHIGRYYQVEYQKNGSAVWEPMCSETWYYSRYLGDGMWQTLVRAPEDLGEGLPACYLIPDYYDFLETNKTIVMRWCTHRKDGNIARYPDGLYKLRVKVIEKTGEGQGTVVAESVFDPNLEQLSVMVDNGWPEAEILHVYSADYDGTTMVLSSIPECGMVQTGEGRFLVFEFKANDPEAHFRNYTFRVNRGQNQPTNLPMPQPAVANVLPPTPGFALQPPALTYVGLDDNHPRAFTSLYLGTDLWDTDQNGNPVEPLKPCAYNFTLTVRDRVVNGYGWVHWKHWVTTLSLVSSSTG